MKSFGAVALVALLAFGVSTVAHARLDPGGLRQTGSMPASDALMTSLVGADEVAPTLVVEAPKSRVNLRVAELCIPYHRGGYACDGIPPFPGGNIHGTGSWTGEGVGNSALMDWLLDFLNGR
jgi:hypothetical protein